MAQLVSRHSCVADRLPVVARFPASPRVRLKTVDPPKGNRLGQRKIPFLFLSLKWIQLHFFPLMFGAGVLSHRSFAFSFPSDSREGGFHVWSSHTRLLPPWVGIPGGNPPRAVCESVSFLQCNFLTRPLKGAVCFWTGFDRPFPGACVVMDSPSRQPATIP